jgi:uncharacterized protein YndB with AHSA1/START domain
MSWKKRDVAGNRVGGRIEVRRFERRLRHRPEKVWRALTEADELAGWFPARVEGKREKGACLRFRFEGEEPDAEGRITEWEPPRLFAYTMGAEMHRWELSPLAEDGCLLVLTSAVVLESVPANDNGALRACLAA